MPADTPRQPRTKESFDALYAGTPPWDIGRPQPVFAALAQSGALRGRILDVGCGTGEHVLMAAAMGLDATGLDGAPTAIALAQAKSRDRGIPAQFLVGDALDLPALGVQFDTIIDSGLFHVFEDPERRRFVESLSAALKPGGEYIMACFSDLQPGDWGPRRVTQAEIRASFSAGWQVESIDAARFDVLMDPGTVQAWLARIRRL